MMAILQLALNAHLQPESHSPLERLCRARLYQAVPCYRGRLAAVWLMKREERCDPVPVTVISGPTTAVRALRISRDPPSQMPSLQRKSNSVTCRVTAMVLQNL
ncbi:hypothetical protein llap_12064 [Limosa lapponica baueri]|uniref:Uncharacterized protein n=1 Tax=Limosa lapponica baueri TaxID=1758121 RepID=A0A2I0TV17_LIMLA|nr:hypothetical protein llap_12064 [Limosa lapponica baueri]